LPIDIEYSFVVLSYTQVASEINLPTPKIIEPVNWSGSTHAQRDVMFQGANRLVFARPESLKGIHAVANTSNYNKDDQTPQLVSTLANPVEPCTYQYVAGPEVSINQVTTTIADNEFNIPAGEYFLINRANRTPMRERGLKDTYEFPGRVWKSNGEDAIEVEEIRQKVLLTSELDLTESEAQKLKTKPLIENLAPAAGNSSMIQRISEVEIPQSCIMRLVKKYGATFDTENQVVKISRKCDGGIIQGLEMIPKDKIIKYLSEKSKDGNAIASSTYAGLSLCQPLTFQNNNFKAVIKRFLKTILPW
jgi:hypothetical protein